MNLRFVGPMAASLTTVLALAACGGGTQPVAQTITVTAAPSTSVSADPDLAPEVIPTEESTRNIQPGPTYARPEAMYKKLVAAGFPCEGDSEPSTMNINGAFGSMCRGPDDEAIAFYTFENDAVGDAQVATTTSDGTRVVYRGPNWSVDTTRQATLSRVSKILARP